MSIVAQSPPHRYSSVMQLRFCYAMCDHSTLCLLSLRSLYDQRASAATLLFRHSQPWRFCYALGVLANSRPCSSALLKLVSLFRILGPIMSGSFSCNLIMKSHLSCSLLLLVCHSAHIVAVYLRIIMDGSRPFWPSDPVLPGPPIIQKYMSVVHNGQLRHSDLSASIVGIQLNINQLNFRFDIERIQKCNESVSPSPRS